MYVQVIITLNCILVTCTYMVSVSFRESYQLGWTLVKVCALEVTTQLILLLKYFPTSDDATPSIHFLTFPVKHTSTRGRYFITPYILGFSG